MPGRRAPEAERREQILAAAFAVACRQRLEGLTIRAVASEAGLSPGLVLFHLGSRDELLLGLLDWLLAGTIIGTPDPAVQARPSARERLLGLIEQELVLIAERRPRLELFFDFWVAGISHPKIRGKIRRALARYRDAALPLAAAAIAEAPRAFRGITAPALAGLAVAGIEGCVMQAVVDPHSLDVAAAMATLTTMLPAPPRPRARRRAPRVRTPSRA